MSSEKVRAGRGLSRWYVGWLAGWLTAAAFGVAALGAEPVPDFCFLQVSDIHISPQPAGEEPPKDGRSVETIGWVCQEAKLAQRLEPSGLTTPTPSFVVATGDLTEYGVIGNTWANFESYWKPLGVPLYEVAGNHDNTWTTIAPILRKRHGGDHYSFDQFGCHFAFLDSATIQEPLPSLEARTLNWLRADLRGVEKDVPVFLFQHHPLGTTEFATPMEQLRFLEVLREHNVVLLLMGHGHGVRAERWNGLDSVMGGSTFGPNSGYSIISAIEGTLRVVYRYADKTKPMTVLAEKPLAVSTEKRPNAGWVVDQPTAGTTITETDLHVAGKSRRESVRACLDGKVDKAVTLPVEAGSFRGSLATAELTPGHHFLLTEAGEKNDLWQQATEFLYRPASCKVKEARSALTAGMKAGPVVIADGCLVATTDGQIVRINDQGQQVPVFKTGVEILHAPAVVDGNMYFSSAELGVFAVSLDGKLLWKCPLKGAVYGTPAVVGDRVYVGDLEGVIHALDRQDGKVIWSKKQAMFSIEMPLVADGGVLYFGAWDGKVYAVNAGDGELRWKSAGPAGQTTEAALRSRYYAPADCAPVVVGERLFVCDRSYRLGSYSQEGKYLGPIAEGIGAIGLTQDGKGFYARGLESGITRYDGEGKKVWSTHVEMGRFPCPPTAVGGRVYACSNLGLLSVMDAESGKLLSQYQVSPRLHIMAPVAADQAGKAYVAGMDGSVTILGLEFKMAD